MAERLPSRAEVDAKIEAALHNVASDHDVHAAVRRLLAQAWDEGEAWRRGRGQLPAVLGDANPYRRPWAPGSVDRNDD